MGDMMRVVFALILFIGIAIAGGAVYMAMERFNQYEAALANSRQAPVKQIKLAKGFVAKNPLEYGMPLTKDDVQLIDWPAEFMPEGVFSDELELLGTGEEGDFRTVLREMEPGEPLMKDLFLDG